jgi:hypothetical protein
MEGTRKAYTQHNKEIKAVIKEMKSPLDSIEQTGKRIDLLLQDRESHIESLITKYISKLTAPHNDTVEGVSGKLWS